MSATEEDDYPTDVNIHEILNCISQLEATIASHPRLLWRLPRDFYNFLIVDLQQMIAHAATSSETIDLTKEKSPKVNLQQLHHIFQNGNERYLPLHSVMKSIFEKAWKHDTPWTTSEELISSLSWKAYLEQSSELELCLTSFPLDQILTSLETLKEIRISEIQKIMNKELKRKQNSGLDNFVKKSKIDQATEDSRDPSLSLTSTSSRIMNTCKY